MSFHSPRPKETPLAPIDIPDNPRGLAWTSLERDILRASGYTGGGRGAPRLKVVHPKDAVYQAALQALQNDDWNEEVKRPALMRFNYRGQEFWIMEELPGQ